MQIKEFQIKNKKKGLLESLKSCVNLYFIRQSRTFTHCTLNSIFYILNNDRLGYIIKCTTI